MRLRNLMILSALFFALTSCVHREFEYESSRNAYLDVVFDWQNAPDAQPASMSLYLFKPDGGEPLRFDFVGRDGGTIRLEPGEYDAICVNSDTRDVYYRGKNSHSTFEVTTTEVRSLTFGSSVSVRSFELPRAEGAESQVLAKQPPRMWSSSITSFRVNVTPAAKTKGNNQELRMFPNLIVDKYIVTVRNIKNVEYLNAMSATISHMSDGYLAGRQTHNDEAVTIPMELIHNPELSEAEGEFLTFGHCQSSQRKHRLMVYALMKDNSKYYFEFDVSEQAHAYPDENNIHHIIVECLDLPKPEGGGSTGGFTPTIDDWQSVDIPLPM